MCPTWANTGQLALTETGAWVGVLPTTRAACLRKFNFRSAPKRTRNPVTVEINLRRYLQQSAWLLRCNKDGRVVGRRQRTLSDYSTHILGIVSVKHKLTAMLLYDSD